jgi:hypothetical protein
MTEHEDAVRDNLRLSEETKLVLEAVIAPLEATVSTINPWTEDATANPAPAVPTSSWSPSNPDRRILALVTHKHGKDHEEGWYVLSLHI